MRLFIGFKLDAETSKNLIKVQKVLEKREGKLRLVVAENLHLTAAFLGEVTESRVAVIKELIKRYNKQIAKLRLVIKGVSGFPSGKRVRTVVVTVGGRDIKKLERIVGRLRSTLQINKIWFDRKPFRAHVTIARIRKGNLRLGEDLVKFRDIEVGLRRLSLFESRTIEGKVRYEEISI